MGRNSWVKQYAICAFIVLLVFFAVNLIGNSESVEQRAFAQLVLKLAYEAKEITGLPASIVAAQLILESGWGKHIPEGSNNYFGIKSDGTQPYVTCYTYEYYNGKYIRVLAKFRKYGSLKESIIDYGRFIYENPRYWRAIANRIDPVKYILEIQNAGYATSPNYADKILRIAELCGFLTVSKFDND